MSTVTAEDWQRMKAHGGALDLSRSVKLRLTGPDAQRYLNGQVSNDLRRLPPGGSLPACLCNHKGRLEALVMISQDGAGAFLVSADAALREFLPLRMEKYLIADDAAIEDVTEAYDLVHVFPPSPEGLSFSASRLGVPGMDLWLPPGAAARFALTGPAVIETMRIEHGIPSWEAELAGGILPPEARLDESAIDYHKGCYTGQEVISRLRSVGQVNRRLERLTVRSGTVEPGSQIIVRQDDGRLTNAGVITSAAWHPVRQEGIALGFVKRSSSGAALLAGPPGAEPAAAVEIRKTLDDAEP